VNYRQQVRRARQELRRDQGIALLNRKLSEQMRGYVPDIDPVTDEASTPVDSAAPGVS
jgi:hypothetical protein